MRTTYEQALRDQTSPATMWADAGIPHRFSGATLDNYSAPEPGPQVAALNWAKDYANAFDLALASGRSALFCGKTGTGKTHLAIAILKHVLRAGCSGRYALVYDLIRDVKDTWSQAATKTHTATVSGYTKPDLLVLDEIGVQFGTDAERNILFEVLGKRYNDMRPTILISNLQPDDVAKFLGTRVVDRIRENGGMLVTFTWDSHRSEPEA